MTEPSKSQWNKLGKILAVIALVMATIVIFRVFTPEYVRSLILESGKYAEIIYVLLWTFLPMGFFPVPILAFAGGMGFGLIKGSVLTFVGAAFNLSFMFLMARYLFRRPVQDFLYRKYPQTKDILSTNKKRLKIALALARLIPLVPYNVENYAFGLTDINFFDYLLISLVCILPGTFIYVNVGDKSLNAGSQDFVIAIGLLVLLVVGTAFLAKYMKEPESEKKERINSKK